MKSTRFGRKLRQLKYAIRQLRSGSKKNAGIIANFKRLYQDISFRYASAKLKKAAVLCALSLGLQQSGQAQISFVAPAVDTFNITSLSGSFGFTSIGLADIDDDGDLDLFASNTNTSTGGVSYLQNQGTATMPDFTGSAWVLSPFNLPTPNTTGPRFSSFDFVDIDNDGDLDLFSSGYHNSGTEYFHENIGDSTAANFAAAVADTLGLNSSSNPADINFVDIDNDGDYDYLGGDKDRYGAQGTYKFMSNDGNVTDADFLAEQANPFNLSNTGNDGGADLDFSDLDGDGDYDIIGARTEYSYTSYSIESEFFFIRNEGNVSGADFPTEVGNAFGITLPRTGGLTLGDIDGDGDDDLFAIDLYNGQISYYENTSVPVLSPTIEFDTAATLTVDEALGTLNIPLSFVDGTAAASVDVELLSASTATITDDFTFTNPTTINFAMGDTAQVLSLPIVDDTDTESTEQIILRLTNVSGASIGSVDTVTIDITDNDVVSVITNQEDKLLNAYPNPFKDQLIINSVNTEVSQANIYNTLGQLVKAVQLNDQQTVLNTQAWERGLYTVEVLDKENQVLGRKLVVKQ